MVNGAFTMHFKLIYKNNNMVVEVEVVEVDLYSLINYKSLCIYMVVFAIKFVDHCWSRLQGPVLF